MASIFTLDYLTGKCPHCKADTKLFYVYEGTEWDTSSWKDTGKVECLACGERSDNPETKVEALVELYC